MKTTVSVISAVALAAALQATTAAAASEADVRAIAALPGEPSHVAAGGLTKADERILTLENAGAFDSTASARRLVLVGGFDGDEKSAETVLALVRWFKTAAPAQTKRAWVVSALPAAAFDAADHASLERWITFQAPDVLVEVRGDGAAFDTSSMKPTVVPPGTSGAALGRILAAAPAGKSQIHQEIDRRVSRPPLEIAKLLASRYPETPSISYIPSVAWINTLKLSKLINDPALADKVRRQTAPWVSGAQPLFGDRILLTSVAGTMVFAELGGEATRLAAEGARLAAAMKPSGIAEYGQGWTDDMFMASSILTRVGDFDSAARLLTGYVQRLQRPDGIFMHATDGPFAWGRGNGFAALGMAEFLTAAPQSHASRESILAAYRRQMQALVAQQSPDGMWRQVIDEPGSYREETATAMLTTAIARGIARGWLDASFNAVVARAWRGLAAHVKEDATLVDVCTGTGVGPTKRYYLDRAAITGADDRGGAMALLAAMEVVNLKAR